MFLKTLQGVYKDRFVIHIDKLLRDILTRICCLCPPQKVNLTKAQETV
jgi:hypothetical protein